MIALLLAACQKSKGAYAPEPVPVTVAKVQQKTVQLTVHAIGNVEPMPRPGLETSRVPACISTR